MPVNYMEIYFPALLPFRLLVFVFYTFSPSFFLFLFRSSLPFVFSPPAPVNDFLPRVLLFPPVFSSRPASVFPFSRFIDSLLFAFLLSFSFFPLFYNFRSPDFPCLFSRLVPLILPVFSLFSSSFRPFQKFSSKEKIFSKIFLKTIDKCDILYYTINTLIKLNPIKSY